MASAGKLSDHARKEIRRLARVGWTLSALARKFGVFPNTIRYWAYPENRKQLRGKELADRRRKQREHQHAKRAKMTKKERAEHARRQSEYKRAWLAKMTKKERAEFDRKRREEGRAYYKAARARQTGATRKK